MNQMLQEQIFFKLWKAFGPLATRMDQGDESEFDYLVTQLSDRLAKYEHRGDRHIANILDYLEGFGGNTL
jgi:hypothetical protein